MFSLELIPVKILDILSSEKNIHISEEPNSSKKYQSMHVGMILLYNLFENCHTGLYPFLNNSLFPNLQEYNWFHISETLEMTFTVFWFLSSRPDDETQWKKIQKVMPKKKWDAVLKKMLKFHFCPIIFAQFYLQFHCVRFVYKDDVNSSWFLVW